MNLIEKLVALCNSPEIRIWHFPGKKENPRFFYWMENEPKNKDGYGFDSLEAMIDAAYDRIDLLKKPLPERVEMPSQAKEIA